MSMEAGLEYKKSALFNPTYNVEFSLAPKAKLVAACGRFGPLELQPTIEFYLDTDRSDSPGMSMLSGQPLSALPSDECKMRYDTLKVDIGELSNRQLSELKGMFSFAEHEADIVVQERVPLMTLAERHSGWHLAGLLFLKYSQVLSIDVDYISANSNRSVSDGNRLADKVRLFSTFAKERCSNALRVADALEKHYADMVQGYLAVGLPVEPSLSYSKEFSDFGEQFFGRGFLPR